MDTEKLKPFNEFNSEKSAMVNEICYRLFNEPSNNPDSNFFKELKKIQIPSEIKPNTQISIVVGSVAEYVNTGFLPILVNTNNCALAFGTYTDAVGARLIIKNTSGSVLSTSGVLYLLVVGVK